MARHKCVTYDLNSTIEKATKRKNLNEYQPVKAIELHAYPIQQS